MTADLWLSEASRHGNFPHFMPFTFRIFTASRGCFWLMLIDTPCCSAFPSSQLPFSNTGWAIHCHQCYSFVISKLSLLYSSHSPLNPSPWARVLHSLDLCCNGSSHFVTPLVASLKWTTDTILLVPILKSFGGRQDWRLACLCQHKFY
jgi:hypothetical protein